MARVAGWFHIFDDFNPWDDDLQEYLDFYGEQGFQLVEVTVLKHDLHRFYFKRIRKTDNHYLRYDKT